MPLTCLPNELLENRLSIARWKSDAESGCRFISDRHTS